MGNKILLKNHMGNLICCLHYWHHETQIGILASFSMLNFNFIGRFCFIVELRHRILSIYVLPYKSRSRVLLGRRHPLPVFQSSVSWAGGTTRSRSEKKFFPSERSQKGKFSVDIFDRMGSPSPSSPTARPWIGNSSTSSDPESDGPPRGSISAFFFLIFHDV